MGATARAWSSHPSRQVNVPESEVYFAAEAFGPTPGWVMRRPFVVVFGHFSMKAYFDMRLSLKKPFMAYVPDLC
jgi:hypothetical protein